MRSPRSYTAPRNALIRFMPPDTIAARSEDLAADRTARDGFWTVRELAQYLHISEGWIHERTRRNEIPCHRLGTALRFDPQEVYVWISQGRASAAGGRGAA